MLSEGGSHTKLCWNQDMRRMCLNIISGLAQFSLYTYILIVYPANLDGLKVYHVTCTAKDLVKKTNDRRWFYMRTTSKSGFRGIRKVGTCQGFWSCLNTECSFLKTEKSKNTIHFEHGAGQSVCYSCGQFAVRTDC